MKHTLTPQAVEQLTVHLGVATCDWLMANGYAELCDNGLGVNIYAEDDPTLADEDPATLPPSDRFVIEIGPEALPEWQKEHIKSAKETL